MKYFVVNAPSGAGKDKFIDYCLKRLKGFGLKVSTVDFVKDVAKMCGWDGKKTERNRKFLGDLKQLLIDWGNVPFHKVVKEISVFSFTLGQYDIDEKNGVVFIICRESEEIQKFVDFYGAKTIWIDRKAVENIEHLSEHDDVQCSDYKYDYIIPNNGNLAELEEKAENFLDSI